jgi:hypothetical protein
VELDVDGTCYNYEDFREAYFSIATMILLEKVLMTPHVLPIPNEALIHLYQTAGSIIEEKWPNFVRDRYESEAEYVNGQEEEY